MQWRCADGRCIDIFRHGKDVEGEVLCYPILGAGIWLLAFSSFSCLAPLYDGIGRGSRGQEASYIVRLLNHELIFEGALSDEDFGELLLWRYKDERRAMLLEVIGQAAAILVVFRRTNLELSEDLDFGELLQSMKHSPTLLELDGCGDDSHLQRPRRQCLGQVSDDLGAFGQIADRRLAFEHGFVRRVCVVETRVLKEPFDASSRSVPVVETFQPCE